MRQTFSGSVETFIHSARVLLLFLVLVLILDLDLVLVLVLVREKALVTEYRIGLDEFAPHPNTPPLHHSNTPMLQYPR